MSAPRKPEQRAAYFWSKVSVGEPDDCWPWEGGYFQREQGESYGRFAWEKSRSMYAHRLAYQLGHGLAELADGAVIMHICDNPPCCNPAHLREGTSAENTRDRDEKGRACKGERHHESKLTESDVRAIRASELTNARLARDYGVSKTHIGHIKKRRTWKHVA